MKGGRTKNDLDNVSDICKGHGNGAAKSWERDGDWLCPNTGCRNVNFAFRGVWNVVELYVLLVSVEYVLVEGLRSLSG